MTASDLLKRWMFRAYRMQMAHYKCARACETWHRRLGIPAIVLGAITSTAVFASLSDTATAQVPTWLKPWLPLAVGLISVISAVLSALQTFLRDAELAEKHRAAGALFAHLKHEMELLAIAADNAAPAIAESLKSIEGRWEKLREHSPNIPAREWKEIATEIQDNAPAWDYTNPPRR
jgi:hypothetical protein